MKPNLATLFTPLLAAVVTCPVLFTGLATDDFVILQLVRQATESGSLGSLATQPIFQYYRPLALFSFAVDWSLWGTTAAGYHLTSWLLHVANVGMASTIMRRWVPGAGGWIAGTAVAIHPASHEAVYWAAARFDLLATFWCLVSIVIWTGSNRHKRFWVLIPFALALLSKESALSLPAILLAWDVVVRKCSRPELIRRLAPIGLLTIVYFGVRFAIPELAPEGPKWVRGGLMVSMAALLLTSARLTPEGGTTERRSNWLALGVAACFLLATGLLLLNGEARQHLGPNLGAAAFMAFYCCSPAVLPPFADSLFWARDFPEVIAGWTLSSVAVGLLTLAWNRRRANPMVFLGLAWALAAVVPVMGLGGEARHAYFPLFGLALAAGAAIGRSVNRTSIVGLIGLAIIAVWQQAEGAVKWEKASHQVRVGVELITRSIPKCENADIMLLTRPLRIAGIQDGFNHEAFEFLSDCSIGSLQPILRIANRDAKVSVAEDQPGVTEITIHGYEGQIIASTDGRNFQLRIPVGDRRTWDTPWGPVATYPRGGDQVFQFRLTTDPAPPMFYYSGRSWFKFRPPTGQ